MVNCGEVMVAKLQTCLVVIQISRMVNLCSPPILILNEQGGIFPGRVEFIRSGEFIRRAKGVPGEAREE